MLVKNLWLSLDPYMRGRMSQAKSYAKGVEIGDVITGETAGEVIESKHPNFKLGDTVTGRSGLAALRLRSRRLAHQGRRVARPAVVLPWLRWHAGLTAWFGLKDIGQPKAGRDGRRVRRLGRGRQRGRASSRRSRAAARSASRAARRNATTSSSELGFDACVDYKAGHLNDDLKAAAPKGIDVLLRERRRRNPRRGAAADECVLAHRGLRPDLAVQRDRALRREDLPVDPDQPHQGAGLHRLRLDWSAMPKATRSSLELVAGGQAQVPRIRAPTGSRTRRRPSSACSRARISASSWSSWLDTFRYSLKPEGIP